jgi:hypothetical protein
MCKGFVVLLIIAGICTAVGTIVSIVDPEYIMVGLIAIWLTVMCYLCGAMYEAYKEMKNVKPY